MEEYYRKAEDNEINKFGRELKSSDAFRLRSGLRTREKDRPKVHFVPLAKLDPRSRPTTTEAALSSENEWPGFDEL